VRSITGNRIGTLLLRTTVFTLARMPGNARRSRCRRRRTDTFPGERYRRIVKRRGRFKALVARTIVVIVWYLLAGRAGRQHDLGVGCCASRIGTDRKGPQPRP
jgi:hypothetical protein